MTVPVVWMVVPVIVAVLVWVFMRVVVGGGIVVRLSRWVVVPVGVFEPSVLVGMGVAHCRHQSQGTARRPGFLQPFPDRGVGARHSYAIPSTV